MDDRNTRFLNYLFSNKHLTREQRRAISQLLVRDIPNEIEQEPDVVNSDGEVVPNAKMHDVKPVSDFLHLFTEKEALKYTTHTWDRLSTGKFCFDNYEKFKSQYETILKKHNIYQYHKGLGMLVRNFLINEDPTYSWSEHHIKIGYNKYVEQWMNDNPDEQPMAMPLKAFPTDLKPGPINRSSLSSFGDVVEIFKHCIEFRDNDLYLMVKKVFNKKDFTIDKEKLESLKGIVFYTHTESIKQALEQIAGNVFSRTGHPNIEISCQIKTGNQRDAFVLEILQVGSFSNKPVLDDKVLGTNEDGTINTIIKKIYNLCDYSVESKFRDKDNNIKDFRINYLVSDQGMPLFQEIQSECRGYKTILTFYKYKHNEESNNNR